jgi:short-subunit dehydrogenase
MNKWNTIWITGASSGIGYELSKLLSSEASYIAVSARRESKLKELADNYDNIHSYKLDITNEKESRICIEEIEKKSNGNIDLVVLNAGKSSLFKVNDLDSKAIRECFEVNYMGVIHSLGIIIPKMIKAKTGHIAIVSSVAGYRGLPNSIAYGPTKAALINLAEVLRSELSKYGIVVTLINPGFVDTEMTKVNKFPMPSIVSAKFAAEKIFDGLKRDKYEIAFPLYFSLLLKLLRIIPNSLYFWIVKKFIWK